MNPTTAQNNRDLLAAVLETLAAGEILLGEIDDSSYTCKVPVAFNATIGGHYRHCLDHFQSVVEVAISGDLNYDHRERGTLVETDRFAALNATRKLRERFEVLDPYALKRVFRVTCKTSYANPESQSAMSTVGRELMYSVAHAVHHYALIGVMGGLMGLKMPPGFGVAPSTLKHQQQLAAAA